MSRNPKNADELTKRIADLELQSEAQKQEIRKSAAVFVEEIKPMNLLKNYFRPKPTSVISKWSGKLLGGYKKVFQRKRGIKRLLTFKH